MDLRRAAYTTAVRCSPQFERLPAQETFYRIIEIGFVKGILISLLVLGSLVCLLIGALGGLAVYLRHHDTKLWEGHGELYVFEGGKDEDEEVDISCVKNNSKRSGLRYSDKSQLQSQSRTSRYLSSNLSVPVTRISIYGSPRRMSTTKSDPSAKPWTTRGSVQNAIGPLRSALSRSPPLLKGSPRGQLPLSSETRSRRISMSSTSPTPKSVRWADEIQMTTAEISFSRERATSAKAGSGSHIAKDTRSCGIDGQALDIGDALPDSSSPTYRMFCLSQTPQHTTTFSKMCIQSQDTGHPSDRAMSMKLEGDTF
ncbi:hypothetical protein FOPE_01008 [Fonsecaea pedrosoi]|nr:hypothetical protein FOPE_01008 [Fonsecaea pedrosoi]